MRIIAGSARGLRLKAPDTDLTRPMLDRQKQALFDILQREFPCAGALDVFAGSGGLGLEALSRGAELASFVERGKDALAAIRDNLKTTGFAERSKILATDALKLDFQSLTHEVGVAFLDPPFPLVQTKFEATLSLLDRIAASGRFAADGVVMLRVPVEVLLPEARGGLVKDDERVMGESRLGFYRWQEEA